MILVRSTIDETVLNGLDPEQRHRGEGEGDDASSMYPIWSMTFRRSNTITGDAFNSPYLLDLRPYSEFNQEAGVNKLLNLRIGSDRGPHIAFVVPGDVHATDAENPDDEDDFAWRQTQFLRLSGWVSLESRLSVSLCKECVFEFSDSQS